MCEDGGGLASERQLDCKVESQTGGGKSFAQWHEVLISLR